MTAILRDNQGDPLDEFNSELAHGGCSVCGAAASAVWHGVVHVRICGGCAVRDLPRLIADAVFATNPTPPAFDLFKDREREVLLNYWRGVAAAQASRRSGLSLGVAPAEVDEPEAGNGGS